VDVAEVDMRDAATEPPSHKDEASFQIPVKVVHEQGPQKGQSQQQQQHENRQQSQPKQQQEQQQRSRPSAPHGNEEEPKAKKQLTPEEMAVAKVKKVKEEVASLRERIENFKGKKTDKEYLYLDEMLTRQLLSLDGVETFGKDDIRTMRKESINAINRCLSMLDTKVNKGGVAEGEGEKMEQDSAAAANASEEKSSEPEKMEEDSPVNNTKSNAEVSDSALDQLAAERPPQKQ
jgi:BCL2-associated athanogene 3